MNGQSADDVGNTLQADGEGGHPDGPCDHTDHTYSSFYHEIENEVPYSALSPHILMLKKKIRRLHRKAQRQKQKIRTMKRLILQLQSCS